MQDKNKTGFKAKIDSFFGITQKGSSFKIEIIAGIATFLAMAYILTVNPNNILFETKTDDARWASIFIATAFGAIIGTLLMAFLSKMPLAQAPGLGLNAMVSGLLGGGLIGYSLSFGSAMLLVFISGVFGIIWLNFVLEIIINTIFTPAIYKVVKVIKKR